MIKILLLFILIFINQLSVGNCAAPSRPNNYVSGTVIDPVAVTANETTLYSYLQAGVDTYAAGSISNGSISSTAGINYSKLNLSNSILGSDISSSAALSVASLQTTGNIVDGGTFLVGTAHQGDVLYDSGSTFVRLTPGTSGQVLDTQGASANPQWLDSIGVYSYGTSPSTSTTLRGTAFKIAYGQVTFAGGSANQTISNLPFSSSATYNCFCSGGNSMPNSNYVCGTTYSSGSSAILSVGANGLVMNWVCLGT